MTGRWWALPQQDQDRVNEERRAVELPMIPTHRHRQVVEHPPIRFAASNEKGIRPIGECLACGHIHALAVWKDAPLADVTHGLCEACRDAAEHLRGPCSPERGCLCSDDILTANSQASPE